MLIEVLVLILLIFLNALFAASELAFLSVNKIKLNEQITNGNKKAIKIKKLVDEPSSFLATIQIGITLAGFLASAFASETFADYIVQNIAFVNLSASVLKPIIVVIVTMILSYFTLVLGELVPKKVALNYPEKIAYFMVDFIMALKFLSYPFVAILTFSTNLISKILKIEDKEEELLTEEEIKAVILAGGKQGVIEEAEKELILNIFEFNDTQIFKIMTPINNVISINVKSSKKDIIETIKKCKFTRIPVYEGPLDNIIGVLNVKDLILAKLNDKDNIDIMKILREPFFVDEQAIVDDVFRSMQEKKQSMGIVMNDKKEFVGVVTVEDAIEEIVGNIFDEYN